MRALKRILPLAFVFALAAIGSGGRAIAELPSPATPGRYELTIASGGFDRVVRIHIPTGYQPDKKPPLVLMLHGAGGDGAGTLDKDGWAAKADKEGFVVVAPDGLPARPDSTPNFLANPRLWNSGQFKARTARAGVDDVAFIRQLLDTLKEKVPYDESRTYCAGHSNGGGMTFRLGAELGERFAAIGTVAGMMVPDDPKLKHPLPTLFILGTKDPLVPIAGGEATLPWGKRTIAPVAERLADWAKAMGCDMEPREVSNKNGAEQLQYPSKSNGPTLTVIYLEGHGHHWPGGQRVLPERMIGPITSKLDATDVLWEFFQTNGPR